MFFVDSKNSDEGEKDMMVMEGIMERKPGYKGAHDYGSGAVFQEGEEIRRFLDAILKEERSHRKMRRTGEVRAAGSMLNSEEIRIRLGDGREVMCQFGPMQTSTWFLIDEAGFEPIWFKVKDATLCVLGRMLPMEENYRLVQEAEETVRLTPRLKRTVVPRRGHIFFRATNDDENASHVLVQRRWTSTNGYLDQLKRPKRSLFYESKSNNDRRAESINIMTWGRDYFVLDLDDEVRKNFLGKMRVKNVTGGVLEV